MVIVFNWLNLSLPIQLPINIKCFIQISKLLVIFTNKSNIDASNFMLVLSFILLMQISLPKQFINQWNIQIKQYIEQLRRNCFIKVKEDLEKFDISEINIWSYLYDLQKLAEKTWVNTILISSIIFLLFMKSKNYDQIIPTYPVIFQGAYTIRVCKWFSLNVLILPVKGG